MTVVDVAEVEQGREQSAPTPDVQPRGRGGDRWARWWQRRLSTLRRPESVVTILVVASCCVFTFARLQPSQIFKNTTPSGGDLGAHVYLPAYLKDHLLSHWRITGWSPDWFDGFPVLVYYFPLPMLAIVALSEVMPYNIAFKVVVCSGLITLPLAAWALGSLAKLRFPGPACLAAATLPYLFSRQFTIYGGNIASTMAGEFCFSIGLSLALVFLGVVARGLETGRHRSLAAVLLACAALCHVLTAVFAVVGAIVLTLMRLDRRRLRWSLPVLVVGVLLTAFWSLAFELRLPYATDMGYQKITQYISNLFPAAEWWLYGLALVGAIFSITRRRGTGIFLTIMAVLCVGLFRFAPQARLWNARVLPFWWLCLYLLAGLALCEIASVLLESFVLDRTVLRWSLIPLPVVIVLAWLIVVSFPLEILPFGHTNPKTGKYSWLGISTTVKSFVPYWVHDDFAGYQSPDNPRRAEYFALVDEMGRLGKTLGCGQALWEYEPELSGMGTPDALTLLPYWTKGCIGSEEGLYYESSATTPYHFLNQAELSLHPSEPDRGLDYPSGPSVAAGVAHLQMLGVRYYMALTPELQAQADSDSQLRLVAQVGPYPVSYTTGGTTSIKERTWKIYLVSDSQTVAPLINQPVVMRGVDSGGNPWLQASEAWYLDPNIDNVLYAASGPKSWARVPADEKNPPRKPLKPVRVSRIVMTDDSISFNVNRVGVPVVVKVSYFPNWHVSGATGPYRVTPNLMVVVPTSTHVRLLYGYTRVDEAGYTLSGFGILGFVWLLRAGTVSYAGRRRRRGLGRGGPPIASGFDGDLSWPEMLTGTGVDDNDAGLDDTRAIDDDPTGPLPITPTAADALTAPVGAPPDRWSHGPAREPPPPPSTVGPAGAEPGASSAGWPEQADGAEGAETGDGDGPGLGPA
jgi:hypothetical protein